MTTTRPLHGPSRFRALVALLLVVPAQALGVYAMLFAFPGPLGKVLNGASRLWMLVVPLLWTLRVEGRWPRPRPPRRRGMIAGLASGAVIFAVMLGTYALVADRIDLDALRERARATGFDRPVPFASVFAYVILVNSLLEEYVWRWFVYRQAEALMPGPLGTPGRRALAVLLAAALFTAHHVVALAAWVGWPLVALGSVGVFLGAVIWSTLYAVERSLWPCYASHVVADLAILAIAYDLLFGIG